MPRLKNVDVQEREAWVLDNFKNNPRISGPKMNKMLKRKFKSTMRIASIYELRESVLKALGWAKDDRGTPIPPGSWQGPAEAVAARAEPKGEDPLFGRCVVPVTSMEDASGFEKKLAFMNEKGFLKPELRVEAISPTYVIVART